MFLHFINEHKYKQRSQTQTIQFTQIYHKQYNTPQPAVISAIMKQQMTHRMRSVVNDGMDILGGAGNNTDK